MKRYGIPLVVILLVASVMYIWASHVNSKQRLHAQRKIHMDSLKQVIAKKSAVVPTVISVTEPAKVEEKPAVDEEEYHREPITDFWQVKSLKAMPDSIRPQSFVAKPVNFEDEYMEEEEYVGNEDGMDTVATIQAIQLHRFIESTVMKMMKRHLQSPMDADEFGRCPSGFFFVTDYENYDEATHRSTAKAPNEWVTGTVLFGKGCNDTAVCSFRVRYSDKVVEMRDLKSKKYYSLREYEVLKFGPHTSTAELLRSKEQIAAH